MFGVSLCRKGQRLAGFVPVSLAQKVAVGLP